MFRVTGGCYVYGMTFMDKKGHDQSHHLLDVFQFASKAQLDKFYEKIRKAFGKVAGIKDSYAVSRIGEYQIVGPQPESTFKTNRHRVDAALPIPVQHQHPLHLRTVWTCSLMAMVNGWL